MRNILILLSVFAVACAPLLAPAQSALAPRGTRTYLPYVVASPLPTPTQRPLCGNAPAAVLFYALLRTSARQQRKALICDQRLVNAAVQRALVQPKTSLSHCDAAGVCANTYVRRAGFPLLRTYTIGNQVESLAAGTPDAAAAFNSLNNSPSHSIHLFGLSDFFRRQQHVGIAVVDVPGHRYRWVWVILIAEKDGSSGE